MVIMMVFFVARREDQWSSSVPEYPRLYLDTLKSILSDWFRETMGSGHSRASEIRRSEVFKLIYKCIGKHVALFIS